jgi:hypothetical protein
MTKEYFFDWNPSIAAFLDHKGMPSETSDADITCIKLEGYNDSKFLKLMLEFCEWAKDTEHDMSINRNANGSKYHKG